MNYTIKSLAILFLFLTFNSCKVNTFMFTEDRGKLPTKESNEIKKCIKKMNYNKKFLRIAKNKKDGQFYLGGRKDHILSGIIVTCETKFIINDEDYGEEPCEDISCYYILKIYNNTLRSINNPYNKCEFYSDGKLKSYTNTYHGIVIGENKFIIDSITKKVREEFRAY